MWFINGLRIMENMMGMMFNQCTCFIQAMEGQENLVGESNIHGHIKNIALSL